MFLMCYVLTLSCVNLQFLIVLFNALILFAVTLDWAEQCMSSLCLLYAKILL